MEKEKECVYSVLKHAELIVSNIIWCNDLLCSKKSVNDIINMMGCV